MLFLYHLQGTKSSVAVPQDDDKQPDLNRDYVCVMDLGLFELSLRMEDKVNGVSFTYFLDTNSQDMKMLMSTKEGMERFYSSRLPIQTYKFNIFRNW